MMSDILNISVSDKNSETLECQQRFFKAENANLDSVLAFVDGFLEKFDVSLKVQMQIDVSVEEIFINICSYAYSEDKDSCENGICPECAVNDMADKENTDSEIIMNNSCREDCFKGVEIVLKKLDAPKGIEIVFRDSGKPFNPLKKEDPDITLKAEDRGIGGLGIFMVKKSMDNVTYNYIDGKNCLSLIKYC